jgi:hypothetical protein
MKMICLPALVLSTCSFTLIGQVVPAAQGPRSLPLSGTLNLTFRYAHLAEKQPAYAAYQTGAASVDLVFSNDNQHRPLQLMYTGGSTWMVSGPGQVTGSFQRLYVAQSFIGRKWTGVLSNDVGYLPAAPTTGFSGIPGIGEPIGLPNPGTGATQSILTVNTHTVDNISYGSLERRLNRSYSLRGDAAWGILRYPDGGAFDSDSLTGTLELGDRLSARTEVMTGYRASRFTYPGLGFDVLSQSVYLGVTHAWNARLFTELSAGPEWTASSATATPSSLGPTITAAANYTSHLGAANIRYTRGINNGSGYYPGALLEMVNGGFFHDFRKSLSVGITGSLMRTKPLVGDSVGSAYCGAQVTRRLGRFAGVFASYTALRQTSTASLPGNALAGVSHVFSAGVEFSPRVKRIHR